MYAGPSVTPTATRVARSIFVRVRWSRGLVGVLIKAGAEAGAGQCSTILYQACTGHNMEPGIRGISRLVAVSHEWIVFDDLTDTSSPEPCGVTSRLVSVWRPTHVRGEVTSKFDCRKKVKYAVNRAEIGA